ncbi:MAG: transglycosylase SLT domain-containing protein, partial [Bacteroidota bacterium]
SNTAKHCRKMKPLFPIFLLILLANAPQAFANHVDASAHPLSIVSPKEASNPHIPTYTDQELIERLRKINSAISIPRLTPAVKSYIRTYTVKKRDRTEAMLGRASIYFPIFESYLQETRMPDDLKYLSVVESALDPTARSRSGAVGLWQFMAPTGRENGLKINSALDERKDPHKATKAALKYLLKQYRRYGNWELALAAYNGGPGRVNRAIKRGRSKNFWRIQRYLPRETRNYVPAFIAATYILNYYHLHNLTPVYPSADLQITQRIKIYDRLSFHEIANVTGTPMDIIVTLNPSYKRKYIPANRRGNNLILPQNHMYSMLSYLGRPDSEIQLLNASTIPAPMVNQEWESRHLKTTYTVQSHDNLEYIASLFACTVQDLRNWNRLRQNYVTLGQELIIYVPKPKNLDFYTPIAPLPSLEMAPFPHVIVDHRLVSSQGSNRSKTTRTQRKFIPQYDSDKANNRDHYLYHTLKRNETLLEVAEQYSGVGLSDILQLNQVDHLYHLKPGTLIRVKKK